MKRLWIELSRKRLNLLFIHSMRSAHKSLSYAKVLQIKAAMTAKVCRESLVHLSQLISSHGSPLAALIFCVQLTSLPVDAEVMNVFQKYHVTGERRIRDQE
jgi:hypothetical protein